MINKMVRIKDIAVKAGVSTGTVDRVLHNRGRVSKKVLDKVSKIIEEMNYEPNVMARALVANKVYHLAALIPDPAKDSFWLAPKEGIEKAGRDLKQFGIHIRQYIFDPFNLKSFVEKATAVNKDNPDGILISPIFYHESLPFFKKWKKKDIPVILFNTQITEIDPLAYVGQDSYQSGLLAGKLVHYGQSSVTPCSTLIAHIDEEISNSIHLQKKEKGFRNYFTQNNLDVQFQILRVELTCANRAGFTKAMDEMIENHPDLTSIFVTTCKSYEVANYLQQRRITHLKIVGYDLIPENLFFLENDRISFLINQNPRAQGYWGINMLSEHLAFKKPVPALKYLPLDIVTKENMNTYLDIEKPFMDV